MNFIEFAQIAGEEKTRKIKDDDYFNSYIADNAQVVDPADLDGITRGAQIAGIEPIDYPFTDGLYIYLKQPTGAIIALLIEADPDDKTGSEYNAIQVTQTTF